MKVKMVQIDDDVRQILRRATFGADFVKLSDADAGMDRAIYERVDKVLVAAGGKWNRSRKAHVFKLVDPRTSVLAALETNAESVVHRQQTLQDFPTPRWAAVQIGEIAQHWMRALRRSQPQILEPSAGRGELVRVVHEVTGVRPFCVEIDRTYARDLLERGYEVAVGDFLTMPLGPVFDIVAMNPPFTGGGDAKHVLRAFDVLRPLGILIAVVPSNALAKGTKHYDRLKWLHEQHSTLEGFEIPAGSFEDTNVAARVIVMQRPGMSPERTVRFNDDGSYSYGYPL